MMAKRKRATGKVVAAATAPAPADPELAPAEQTSYGAPSLHELFNRQIREMLDRSDLDEEQKQNILVAMNCPCCGAGAMSYTVKLKR
jgi:hypothetical protein